MLASESLQDKEGREERQRKGRQHAKQMVVEWLKVPVSRQYAVDSQVGVGAVIGVSPIMTLLGTSQISLLPLQVPEHIPDPLGPRPP